ncbi:unnamed protein product [Heterobilharzia americana]|nr:unnamed protein product [Heterobilharzia americana]
MLCSRRSTISLSLKLSLLVGTVLYFSIHICGLALSTNGILLKGLKFTRPCPNENYRFHNATGNFMCVVPTAKKCFELCQELGSEEIKNIIVVAVFQNIICAFIILSQEDIVILNRKFKKTDNIRFHYRLHLVTLCSTKM